LRPIVRNDEPASARIAAESARHASCNPFIDRALEPKKAAWSECSKLSYELTDLVLDHACTAGSLSYKYECCD
jgi:hypothetical protein